MVNSSSSNGKCPEVCVVRTLEEVHAKLTGEEDAIVIHRRRGLDDAPVDVYTNTRDLAEPIRRALGLGDRVESAAMMGDYVLFEVYMPINSAKQKLVSSFVVH